jgi:TonB family protein
MEMTPQNNSSTSNLPIGWFVLFSLLLHALLFWGVLLNDSATAPMPAAQPAASGLHISLAPYQLTTQRTEAKHQKDPATKQNKPHAVAQEMAQATDNETDLPQVSDSAFREQILVKLRQAISAHFTYPLLARKRNWQGEVLLTFRLERDGRITGVRIARSSGYGLLDHAALNALVQVERLGKILPHSLTVEFPIIYRLEG